MLCLDNKLLASWCKEIEPLFKFKNDYIYWHVLIVLKTSYVIIHETQKKNYAKLHDLN